MNIFLSVKVCILFNVFKMFHQIKSMNFKITVEYLKQCN